MRQPTIHDMGVGDVAYGIAVQAVKGKWAANKLGPYMAQFAVDYANEVGRPITPADIEHLFANPDAVQMAAMINRITRGADE